MSYRGRPNWPPEWIWVSGTYDKKPEGEAGILENVRLSAVNEKALFLSMSYGGSRYVAQLTFDDSNFCRELCEWLKQYYGWRVKLIADLDVP